MKWTQQNINLLAELVLTEKTSKIAALFETTPQAIRTKASKLGLKIPRPRSKSVIPGYNSYNAAKARCNNPNRATYSYYGGRGIKFLFESFDQFMKELGPKPKGMSVDRIDTEGHYEPGNVKWSTQLEQGRNTRTNKLNEYKVKEIKRLRKLGLNTYELGRLFKVDRGHISSVITNRVWKDIE